MRMHNVNMKNHDWAVKQVREVTKEHAVGSLFQAYWYVKYNNFSEEEIISIEASILSLLGFTTDEEIKKGLDILHDWNIYGNEDVTEYIHTDTIYKCGSKTGEETLEKLLEGAK
ncbi:hypothetical protein [Bacillus toyonensis]|uniref:hypothetical protein n=1 Tax=Bacillus toyonensis TaxID=155322 RepID=UPI000BF06332|nr:hypothetical protein [Bacillus toyonensis]PEL24359.1 hypothetical protein CN624_18405 [Bacillus toyonensis]